MCLHACVIVVALSPPLDYRVGHRGDYRDRDPRADGVTAANCYRLAVVLCGVAVVVVLIHTIGPEAILASFRQLSWRPVVVIVFPCALLKMLDTLLAPLLFRHPG